MPIPDTKGDEKAPSPAPINPSLAPQPVKSALSPDAFIIPPVRIKAEVKEVITEKVYQVEQPLKFSHDEKIQDEELRKLYNAFIKWGQQHEFALENLTSAFKAFNEIIKANEINKIKVYLEEIYYYLIGDDTEKNKKEFFTQFVTSDIVRCATGNVNELEARYKQLGLRNRKTIHELLLEIRKNIIENYAPIHIGLKPHTANHSTHIVAVFRNYAHDQKLGLPYSHDDQAFLADITPLDQEQFHQFFARENNLPRILHEIASEIYAAIASEGLPQQLIAKINAAETEISYLKHALIKILEKHGVGLHNILTILRAIQGEDPVQFAVRFENFFRGIVDEPVRKKLFNLTTSPDQKHAADKEPPWFSKIKALKLTANDIEKLKTGKLPQTQSTLAGLSGLGIDEGWQALPLPDKDLAIKEIWHGLYTDQDGLNEKITRFKKQVPAIFKALGFADSPDPEWLLQYTNVQNPINNFKAFVLQRLYKEQRVINTDAWQILELTNGYKLYLCYSSPTESISDCFWLEDTTGKPQTLYQYLGDEKPAIAAALLIHSNPKQANQIVKALVSSTDAKFILPIANVLITHLIQNPKLASPEALGRFLFILLQQKQWSQAKNLLEIKNIVINLNAYCDPETGNYALHLATEESQLGIVKLLCRQRADTFFVNDNLQSCVAILADRNDSTTTVIHEEMAFITQHADHNVFTREIVNLLSLNPKRNNIEILSPITRRTALQSATLYGNDTLVTILCAFGFDVLKPGGFANKSALEFARDSFAELYFLYPDDELQDSDEKEKTARIFLEVIMCVPDQKNISDTDLNYCGQALALLLENTEDNDNNDIDDDKNKNIKLIIRFTQHITRPIPFNIRHKNHHKGKTIAALALTKPKDNQQFLCVFKALIAAEAWLLAANYFNLYFIKHNNLDFYQQYEKILLQLAKKLKNHYTITPNAQGDEKAPQSSGVNQASKSDVLKALSIFANNIERVTTQWQYGLTSVLDMVMEYQTSASESEKVQIENIIGRLHLHGARLSREKYLGFLKASAPPVIILLLKRYAYTGLTTEDLQQRLINNNLFWLIPCIARIKQISADYFDQAFLQIMAFDKQKTIDKNLLQESVTKLFKIFGYSTSLRSPQKDLAEAKQNNSTTLICAVLIHGSDHLSIVTINAEIRSLIINKQFDFDFFCDLIASVPEKANMSIYMITRVLESLLRYTINTNELLKIVNRLKANNLNFIPADKKADFLNQIKERMAVIILEKGKIVPFYSLTKHETAETTHFLSEKANYSFYTHSPTIRKLEAKRIAIEDPQPSKKPAATFKIIEKNFVYQVEGTNDGFMHQEPVTIKGMCLHEKWNEESESPKSAKLQGSVFPAVANFNDFSFGTLQEALNILADFNFFDQNPEKFIKNSRDLYSVSKAAITVLNTPTQQLPNKNNRNLKYKQKIAQKFARLQKHFGEDRSHLYRPKNIALPTYTAKCLAIDAFIDIKNNIRGKEFELSELVRLARTPGHYQNDAALQAPVFYEYMVKRFSKGQEKKPQSFTAMRDEKNTLLLDTGCFYHHQHSSAHDYFPAFNNNLKVAVELALDLVDTLKKQGITNVYTAEDLKQDLLETLLDPSFLCSAWNSERVQEFFELLQNTSYPEEKSGKQQSWAQVLAAELPARLSAKATALANELMNEWQGDTKRKKIQALKEFAKAIMPMNRPITTAGSAGAPAVATIADTKHIKDFKAAPQTTASLMRVVNDAVNAAIPTEKDQQTVYKGERSHRVKDFFVAAQIVARGLSQKPALKAQAQVIHTLDEKHNFRPG